jgi:hypothetical protein
MFERGPAGDVPSMILWLQRFGGPEETAGGHASRSWQRRARPGAHDCSPAIRQHIQDTQQDELADGKSWNDENYEAACGRSEHPIGDLIESTLGLSDQEVVDAAMLVIANHQHRLPSQWMKRIGDNGFEYQKPGIMAPARMRAVKHIFDPGRGYLYTERNVTTDTSHGHQTTYHP